MKYKMVYEYKRSGIKQIIFSNNKEWEAVGAQKKEQGQSILWGEMELK
jgi:hypothetical protein